MTAEERILSYLEENSRGIKELISITMMEHYEYPEDIALELAKSFFGHQDKDGPEGEMARFGEDLVPWWGEIFSFCWDSENYSGDDSSSDFSYEELLEAEYEDNALSTSLAKHLLRFTREYWPELIALRTSHELRCEHRDADALHGFVKVLGSLAKIDSWQDDYWTCGHFFEAITLANGDGGIVGEAVLDERLASLPPPLARIGSASLLVDTPSYPVEYRDGKVTFWIFFDASSAKELGVGGMRRTLASLLIGCGFAKSQFSLVRDQEVGTKRSRWILKIKGTFVRRFPQYFYELREGSVRDFTGSKFPYPKRYY